MFFASLVDGVAVVVLALSVFILSFCCLLGVLFLCACLCVLRFICVMIL